jgi:hypothetical protein
MHMQTERSNSATAEREPPRTYRLNDEATDALWRAYLDAKHQDPFLSLRQYLSRIVLDTLNRKA